MATAGFENLVKVNDSSDPSGGTGFANVNGINSFSIGDSINMLDITDFADAGLRRRIGGLRDVQIQLSGDFEPGDTDGVGVLKAAYDGRDPVYVHVLWDGTYATGGYEYRMLVSDFSINGTVDGKLEVSMTLMLDDDGAGGGVQALTT